MKYYSEITKRLYDTEEDLNAAEVEKSKEEMAKEKLKAQREERAKEVEEAIKKISEAQKEAEKLLTEFTKDYGKFHMTLKDKRKDDFVSLFDLFF